MESTGNNRQGELKDKLGSVAVQAIRQTGHDDYDKPASF